jgi:hypothetical protein
MVFFIFVFFVVERRAKFSFSRYVVPTVFTRAYTFSFSEKLNGSILSVYSVIKNVVAYAAESEVGACFHNTQSGGPLRVTLTELGHITP